MIAYYALGGGLGHLRRAVKILPHLRAMLGDESGENKPALLLTASLHAQDPRTTAGYDVVQVPRELAASRSAFSDWLKAFFSNHPVRTVFVDAFPLGILGEFADPGILPNVPLIHIARLLRFSKYREAFPGVPRRYTATVALEALNQDHETFLRCHSDEFRAFRLPVQDSLNTRATCPAESPLAMFRIPGRPLWLVVHAGAEAELRRLLEFAADHAKRERVSPTWVVVSPHPGLSLGCDVVCLNHVPADECFPDADRIITACGFNSMLDAAPFRDKHWFMPFPRRFDDQFLRAERAREEA